MKGYFKALVGLLLMNKAQVLVGYSKRFNRIIIAYSLVLLYTWIKV